MPRSSNSPWRVLMLVTGHGSEALRDRMEEFFQELGFELHVYDAGGYPVDPLVHSHEASIRAIHAHDIVVAFLDITEGESFRLDAVSGAMLTELRDLGALPAEGAARPVPTVTQVEVLTARSLGKPVLVFMTAQANLLLDESLTLLRNAALDPRPRAAGAPAIGQLLDEHRWEDLLELYEVPTGRIASFRHLLFLDRLRHEAPNYVTFFDQRHLSDFLPLLKSRLAGVVPVLVRQHAETVQKRLQRFRSTLTRWSLRDLLSARLILEPPYEVTSGTVGHGVPLYDIKGEEPQALASTLLGRNNVLLLGDPGHGKSTAALLSFRELVAAASGGVEGYAPLYANLRDIPIRDNAPEALTGGAFIRTLLALPAGRAPWPSSLPLPNLKWLLVLDGADESQLTGRTLAALLRDLPPDTRVLLTCRETVFERVYGASTEWFDVILVLSPWERHDIERYVSVLRVSGQTRAASLIEQFVDEPSVSPFISIPLWLSMLAYLAERRPGEEGLRQARQLRGSYELLRICASAVAEDEAERHDLPPEFKSVLQRLWREVAWLLGRSRTQRRILRWDNEREPLGVEAGSDLERAVLSVLDVPYEGEVNGFFHEIFFEYWLAEYIVDRLIKQGGSPPDTASLFSFQRSYVTDHLIRDRIASYENAEKIAASLREAYYATGALGLRRDFVRHQILYLIARIDSGPATRDLVRTVWREEKHELVRYAAAFSGIVLGDRDVEGEYFNELSGDEVTDRLNRAYRLSYYGDLEPIENGDALPEDSGVNDASRTLTRLFKRFQSTGQRHRSLRRVDLFTVRRFLETGRHVPEGVQDPAGIVRRVQDDLERAEAGEFRESALREAARVLDLLTGGRGRVGS